MRSSLWTSVFLSNTWCSATVPRLDKEEIYEHNNESRSALITNSPGLFEVRFYGWIYPPTTYPHTPSSTPRLSKH